MHRRFSLVGFALLMAASLLTLSGCNPKSLVSQNQEIEIGREASQQIESQYPVDTDPQLNAMVNEMGQAIAKCSDRPDLQYTFKILDISDVNAVSLPGGWVYVYRGLIDQTAGHPDQLAGVIAHEVGHISARHAAQMIGREEELSLLIGVLTQGQIQDIAALFANLEFLHWSRVQEYEADKLGIKFLYRCNNWNPQGLIDFFSILLKIEPSHPSSFDQIFATHPVTENRIKRAQTYLDDLRSGKEKP
jgi:beta-barrel assembly-enhancing protease